MVTAFTVSPTPRYWNSFNVTLPSVNAASAAEVGVASTVHNAGGQGGPVSLDMFISAHPTAPGTGAVALPAGIAFSHAYYNSSDSKIYFRFVNPTAVNYTAADVVTVRVVGF